jgi:hypothetical protein
LRETDNQRSNLTADRICAPFTALLRQLPPRERLFEFLRGHDRILYELPDNGPHGVTAQFFEYEDLLCSRRFGTRALAVQWAEKERKAIEQ